MAKHPDSVVLYGGDHCMLVKHPEHRLLSASYDVTFGDGGWERDPGVEYASRDTAMTEISDVIAELRQILTLLSNEK